MKTTLPQEELQQLKEFIQYSKNRTKYTHKEQIKIEEEILHKSPAQYS